MRSSSLGWAAAILAAGMFVLPQARPQGIITTVAGTDWVFPRTRLRAVDAPLATAAGVAADVAGNVYVADGVNHLVMRISPAGELAVVAGNGHAAFSGDGGPATAAALFGPQGIAVDSGGNLFIADTVNRRVRRVGSDGIIRTVAGTGQSGFSGDGGPAASAMLNSPTSVAVDGAGNLYIADSNNHRVRRVTPAGTIETAAGIGLPGFSGDGDLATRATLNVAQAVAVDAAGNLFISDLVNRRVRRVSATGVINSVAEGFSPFGLAVDAANNLYVADAFSDLIRRVTPGGAVSTFAGSGQRGFAGDGGPATAALLNSPQAVAVDRAGNVFIADGANGRVRRVATGAIQTVAGNGQSRFAGDGGVALAASLRSPHGIAFDPAGNLFIADRENHRVRRVTPAGVISTLAGAALVGLSGDGGPATAASLNSPYGVAVDASSNAFIADTENHRIRRVTPAAIITTVAGGGAGPVGDNGPAINATLNLPFGVATDDAGNVYIADYNQHRIRRLARDGTITTVAGSGQAGFSGDGGPATSAMLSHPRAVAIDRAGNLYIADYNNHRVRRVAREGRISTLAGTGQPGFSGDGGPAASAALAFPQGVAADAAGNVFIADTNNNRVRRVTADGVIRTVAGSGSAGYAGDGGPATAAALNFPTGLLVDGAGNLYIADTNNHRIREVLAAPPGFQVSPATLSFTATQGAAPPHPQSVTLASAVAFSFAATSGAAWLSVTPSSGAMPATLQVSVDAAQLTPGSYQGTLTVTAADANPRERTVTVRLTVEAAAAQPVLSLETRSLTFGLIQGVGEATQQLSVTNRGGGALAFTAGAATESGGDWLAVSPASGTATPAAPAALTVTVRLGELSPGTYRGTVTIDGAATTLTVPVTLTVSAANRSILLSQTGLSFIAVAQGGVPLPQSFGVLNVGQGSLSWTARASTLSGGQQWLQIAPSNGLVERPFLDVNFVNVLINPAGLAPGDYYGRVQLTAAAVNSPQVVTVVLSVLPPGTSPGPEVRPTGLVFTGLAGASPGSQDVKIANPKAQLDSFISAVIGSGFSHSPTSATVGPDEPGTLRVFPEYTRLGPGIHRGTITLQFEDGTPRTVSLLNVVAPTGGGGGAAGCGSSQLRVAFTSLRSNFVAAVGQSTTIEVKAVDDCGNPLVAEDPRRATAQVLVRFSNGDPQLNLVPIGGGAWSGSWRPVRAGQGAVILSVTALYLSGSTRQGGQADLVGVVQQGPPTPLVTAGGVVHAASFVDGAPIAPGSLITLYGANLAERAGLAGGLPLPKEFNGAEVLLGDRPLPLLYTSEGQLNVQVPYDLPVNTQHPITVRRSDRLSMPEPLTVAEAQPGIFTENQTGRGQGSILRSDQVTLAKPGTPAAIGEAIVIYCTGLGAVTPPVAEGQAAPLTPPLSETVNRPVVRIGGRQAQVLYSGLAPGYAGLYQVNAIVPEGVAPGDAVPVTLTIAGQTSPAVTMAVR